MCSKFLTDIMLINSLDRTNDGWIAMHSISESFMWSGVSHSFLSSEFLSFLKCRWLNFPISGIQGTWWFPFSDRAHETSVRSHRFRNRTFRSLATWSRTNTIVRTDICLLYLTFCRIRSLKQRLRRSQFVPFRNEKNPINTCYLLSFFRE